MDRSPFRVTGRRALSPLRQVLLPWLAFGVLACGGAEENAADSEPTPAAAEEELSLRAAPDSEPEDAGSPSEAATDENEPAAEPEERPVLSALRDRLDRENEAREEAKAAVEDAQLAFDTAKARLDQKSEALAQAREAAELALAEVDALEPEVSAAEAELRSAEETLRELGAKLPPETATVADPLLFRSVQRELLEAAALSKVAISAEVREGVVTLRGVVPDADTRAAAVAIAESVEGVVEVDDQLSEALEAD